MDEFPELEEFVAAGEGQAATKRRRMVEKEPSNPVGGGSAGTGGGQASSSRDHLSQAVQATGSSGAGSQTGAGDAYVLDLLGSSVSQVDAGDYGGTMVKEPSAAKRVGARREEEKAADGQQAAGVNLEDEPMSPGALSAHMQVIDGTKRDPHGNRIPTGEERRAEIRAGGNPDGPLLGVTRKIGKFSDLALSLQPTASKTNIKNPMAYDEKREKDAAYHANQQVVSYSEGVPLPADLFRKGSYGVSAELREKVDRG